jgi:hypothetical protein
MENLLIISCIFGKNFKKTYKAPLNKNCVFFTNNENLKHEIINNGWKYFYINFELTDDYIISSLQSKYIKFLIFLKDYPEFNKFLNIIYTDHKFKLHDIHINQFLSIQKNEPTKVIIIRKTPMLKTSIREEIACAKNQERYLKNMNATIHYIEDKIKHYQFKMNDIRISNTGIIFYNNININNSLITSMLYDIYNSCITLQQPECQIFWALYSQNYLDKIKQIEFYEINPLWQAP